MRRASRYGGSVLVGERLSLVACFNTLAGLHSPGLTFLKVKSKSPLFKSVRVGVIRQQVIILNVSGWYSSQYQ